MPCPIVHFDESGNTGQDLLNREQPVFVLASLHLSSAALEEVRPIFSGVRSNELKYSALKRSPRGQRMILDFVRHAAVNSRSAKVAIVDKRFMVYAKLVDMIHEPLLRERGVNMYEQRSALATANLFALVYPVCAEAATLDRFLGDFITAVRGPSPAGFRMLQYSARSLQRQLEAHAVGQDIAASLAPVVVACDRPEEVFPQMDPTQLDPLVPAYHHLADAWGKTLGERYVIEADHSKVLARTKPLLMRFSDPEIAEHQQDYYGDGYLYPFKVEEIRPVESENALGVQLADVLAGAHAHFATKLAQRATLNGFEQNLRDVLLGKELAAMTLWPTRDVTPEALGAVGPMNSDPADYAARILAGDASTRRV